MSKNISSHLSKLSLRIKQHSNFFKKNEDGVVAIEFALVALPFLLLMFAIFEIAMVFYAEINIAHATSDTARKIRTQQASIQTITEFKNDVCSQILFVPNCTGKLKAEVQVFDDFKSINKTDPLNGQGEVKDNFVFNLGTAGSVITVRTFIEWDLFVKLPKLGLSNMPNNNNRLIQGIAVFRNEP